MMYQELEDADYAETDEYQVINIPYKNFDFSMNVVLPKKIGRASCRERV